MAVTREIEAARPYGRQWVDVRAYRLRKKEVDRNKWGRWGRRDDGVGEIRKERAEGEVEMRVEEAYEKSLFSLCTMSLIL